MTQTRLAIHATNPQTIEQAEQLAARLHLDIYNPSVANAYDYLLLVTPQYIGLQKLNDKSSTHPFYIDFNSGKLHYRSQQAGMRNELLARALGVKPRDNPIIVDATAGLGRDSFILATLGFNVTLLERSAIIHTLLQDGLNRAKQVPALTPVINRMHLIHTDATLWLPSTHPQPDIIYLDPMFPQREKSASVKKEMVILQDLLGKCEDQEKLFTLALTCASKRVVVKRPRLAANIVDREPNFTIPGKSSRFDIYLSNVHR